jgi:hypothetical protein
MTASFPSVLPKLAVSNGASQSRALFCSPVRARCSKHHLARARRFRRNLGIVRARLGLSTTDQYASISLIWKFPLRNSVARTRKNRVCCGVSAKLCSETVGIG